MRGACGVFLFFCLLLLLFVCVKIYEMEAIDFGQNNNNILNST